MDREKHNITIFIFDDHDSVRESYARWLQYEGFEVVGGQSSLDNCLEVLNKCHPRVVLMDIDYPSGEFSGIAVAKNISQELPRTRVVFASHYNDPEIIARSLASGACGYFAKSDELRFLREVIEKAAEGYTGLSPTAAKKLVEAVVQKPRTQLTGGSRFHLTPQEHQVLVYIARGLSNKEIAEEVGTNEKRIKNVIAALLAKLDAKNRAQAVVVAMRDGLIDL